MLFGEDGMARLHNARVAVFGLGGVGGQAAETLVRSGIGHLTVCDNDTVSETNRNRQLYALRSTVGQPKAEVAAARCRDINEAVTVHPIVGTYDAQHREDFFGEKYDYIVDCIDLVSCKLDKSILSNCILDTGVSEITTQLRIVCNSDALVVNKNACACVLHLFSKLCNDRLFLFENYCVRQISHLLIVLKKPFVHGYPKTKGIGQ